jgi:hypothetical protein
MKLQTAGATGGVPDGGMSAKRRQAPSFLSRRLIFARGSGGIMRNEPVRDSSRINGPYGLDDFGLPDLIEKTIP